MDNFFSYLNSIAQDSHHKHHWHGNQTSSSPVKSKSLADHDRRFHPNGYKPGDTCSFRESLEEYGDRDDLEYRLSDPSKPTSKSKAVKSFKLVRKEGHKSSADNSSFANKRGDNLLDEVMSVSSQNVATMKSISDGIAQDIGGVSFTRKDAQGNPSTKTRERTKQKGDDTFRGDYTKVNDIVGATVVVPESESFLDAVESMKNHASRNGAQVVRVHPYEKNGYRDVKCTLRFGNGALGEIVMSSQFMINAKDNRGGHTVFEAMRNLANSTRAHYKIMDAFKDCERLSEMIYARGKNVPQPRDFQKQKDSVESKINNILSNQYLAQTLSQEQKDGLTKAISKWSGVVQ